MLLLFRVSARPPQIITPTPAFSVDAINKFLKKNNLLSVIRAHEAQLDGYKMHRWNGPSDFPVVITIFSAPNYCDVYNNKGAIIKFEVASVSDHLYRKIR